MSLYDAAIAAHEHASQCVDAFCHRKAAALLAAVDAEARAVLATAREYICIRCGRAVDPTGEDPEYCPDCVPPPLPPPPVSHILIPRSEVQN